jgi:hypothetical protein
MSRQFSFAFTVVIAENILPFPDQRLKEALLKSPLYTRSMIVIDYMMKGD